jgi:hypothetical protein
MQNIQIDANLVIDEYVRKTTELTHEITILKAYVKTLENELKKLKEKPSEEKETA